MHNVYEAIRILFEIIELLILVRVIMSWLRVSFYSPIGRIVYELTEPILSIARGLIYKIGIDTGMFDFSPIVALLILNLFQALIINFLNIW
ncbi:MAG: YggT family protein [Tissierellia bacterium]|nr:YggT family protein [Tissierellia bacterium]